MTFESEQQLTNFLADFESGGISAQDWTHAAHIAMATAYTWDHGAAAFYRIRAGIHHLNWHHGTISTEERGYHETLTIFWTKITTTFCEQNRPVGKVAAVNRAIAELPSGLFREYYSFDVLKSREARRNWIGPDLKRLS
jgi:hypothetical protein